MRKFRLLRSRQLGGEPGRPPALAVDRFDYRPSDIRSPRSRHRQSPPPSSLGGMRATDPRPHEPITGGGTPPPASAAAARAPPAGALPLRRSAERGTRDASFDHLVGEREQRWSHFNPQRFCGLEVDYQLVLRGRLHGKVGGLFAFEDAVHVTCCTYVWVNRSWPVGDKTATMGEIA